MLSAKLEWKSKQRVYYILTTLSKSTESQHNYFAAMIDAKAEKSILKEQYYPIEEENT